MNNKTALVLLALAFVLLLGGAAVLYDRLGGQSALPQLSTTNPQPSETGSGDPSPSQGDTQTAPGGSQEPSPTPSREPDGNQEDESSLAPDFTVYDREGNAVKLSDFRGKPVVLNFWASWCGPCESEMPDFDEAYGLYGDEIHFLMVNMTDGYRETIARADAFIADGGYTFPVYYDTDGEAAAAYGVTSIPATYFIDARGAGVAYGLGALDMETLMTGIGMIYAP